MSAALLALARDLEARVVAVLIDRGAYLHGADVVRLRHDPDRLRIGELRDERSRLLLEALRRLAQADIVPTIEAVAHASGIAVAHVQRLVDEVQDEAIVDLVALEDQLLEVRHRLDVEVLAHALVRIAAEAEAHDVEQIAAHAAALVDIVQRVQLPEPRFTPRIELARRDAGTLSEQSGQASGRRTITVEVG